MGLNGEVREGVQEVEEEGIYKRTSVSSSRLRQKKIRMKVNILDYTMR